MDLADSTERTILTIPEKRVRQWACMQVLDFGKNLDGVAGFSVAWMSHADMRILFVASEGLPFSKTGGLADVIEALPKALASLGHEVAVLLPRYRNTKTVGIAMPSMSVPMGENLRFPAILEGGAVHGVIYDFVDDVEYFDRDQLYG